MSSAVFPMAGEEHRPPLLPALAGRAVALVAFVATLPLSLVAAVVVCASIGRPLLFRQARCGFGGKPFSICKFRTMRDTRAADGTLLPDHLRETPATRLMRRTRIDEIPQLLAIALGDMAFVGPRPLLPQTIADFGEAGRLRCTVRPGLTGWAQVNGNTRLGDHEKLALDLWYVQNRSVWLDLWILLLTARVVLFGERVNDHNLASAGVTCGPGEARR